MSEASPNDIYVDPALQQEVHAMIAAEAVQEGLAVDFFLRNVVDIDLKTLGGNSEN